MMTIREYRRVENLEEAWELNQKKPNRVIGGMLWLKMGHGRVGTAIDLSGLGLNQIEEKEDRFEIGAMVTLRDLELHAGLEAYTDGAVRVSAPHCWCAVSQSGNRWRKHFWKIWIFRCLDDVFGDEDGSRAVQGRNRPA